WLGGTSGPPTLVAAPLSRRPAPQPSSGGCIVELPSLSPWRIDSDSARSAHTGSATSGLAAATGWRESGSEAPCRGCLATCMRKLDPDGQVKVFARGVAGLVAPFASLSR